MQVLTLIVAIITAAGVTTAAIINEEAKKSVACNKRIPMTEYFEYGYDLSEYDVFACPEMGGKRSKFADLNACNDGIKFKFVDDKQTEYDVPDPFLQAYETSSTYLTAGHTSHQTSDLKDEYLKSTANEGFFGRVEGIEKAVFKNGQFYNEMRAIFANDSRIALTYYQTSIYGMHFYEYKKDYFTPEFVNDTNSLPHKFDGNENTYLNFITKYGTHVIMSAKFGATIYRYTQISRKDFLFGKAADINSEMRKDAFALNDTLDIICEKKDGHRHALKVRAKNRDFIQVIIGGQADIELYANRTAPPTNAIKASPALVSSELKPISSLIKDDKIKQKNVEEAIKVYMTKAYIKSKVYRIKILIQSGREPREQITALINKVEQSRNVYNLDELNQLGNELSSEVSELKRTPILTSPLYHLVETITTRLHV